MLDWVWANSDFIRWLNVALALLSVALLTMGVTMRWNVTPLRIRMIAPWVIFTYLVIAYGSWEAAHASTAPGFRILLMTGALSGLVVALLYHIDEPNYRLPDGAQITPKQD